MRYAKDMVLENEHVRLIPLEESHERELIDAASSGRLWELWYTTIPQPHEMAAEIQRRLRLQREGSMLPFTVVDARSGRVVGQTTFMNIDSQNRRAEIGSTWYARHAQRTHVNTAAKLLLLTHAFDAMQCIAVEFRTSWFNRQSRCAIERLGAKLDGVLRHHMFHRDGTIRDTVVYSIIAAEWPAVRANLASRLA
jgi:RimJ/RimL family protein N-acetyltransferase